MIQILTCFAQIKTYAYKNIDYVPIILLLIFGIGIQTHSIGKLVYTFPDEGVYLYASKLVSQGYLIYRDFSLAHLPFWIYVNALILNSLNWNLDFYHVIYSVYVVFGIIPIYLIVLSSTKKATFSILASILYLTFPLMVSWDAHFFAMRQSSLPLLAWGMYYLTRQKARLAGILLGLFSIGLVTNVIISCFTVILWVVQNLYFNYSASKFVRFKRMAMSLLSSYSVVILPYAIVFCMIPRSIENVFGYQFAGIFVTYASRLQYIQEQMRINWVLILFGVIGCFYVPKQLWWLRISTLVSILILFFCSRSFFSHYLVTLTVPFVITSTYFVKDFIAKYTSNFFAICITIGLLIMTSSRYLYTNLIYNTSPDFYAINAVLREMKDPIFTFAPIYALHSNKNITYSYDVADPRRFVILNTYYTDEQYIDLLRRSNTVLLDPYTLSLTSRVVYSYIESSFLLVYNDYETEIWTKK